MTYTYIRFELVFFLNFVLNFFTFHIEDVLADARPLSPGFVQHIMVNAYILSKDITTS